MIDYVALQKALDDIKPRSKGFYIVQEIVKKWGYWKRKAPGGAFKKGYDDRRHPL